jgi:hypothetical protein
MSIDFYIESFAIILSAVFFMSLSILIYKILFNTGIILARGIFLLDKPDDKIDYLYNKI